MTTDARYMEFVCPICKGPLQHGADVYTCARDQRDYPITLGVPDFRVVPEGSSRAAERALTNRVVAEYPNRSFAELVRLHATWVRAVPPSISAKHRMHLSTGVVRAQNALAGIREYRPLSDRDAFLEIGCGTGAFLVAASQVFRSVVGLDISMVRVLMAKKQLEESGKEPTLICAAAEALPFADNTFHLIVGSDVIEHVRQQAQVVNEAHRLLAPGGALFLATPNRWSLTPEPHVNVWGVGFLPKRLRARYVWLVRKVPYGDIKLLNWFEIRRLLLQTRFAEWRIVLPAFASEHAARLPAWARAAVPLYHAFRERLLLKSLLYLFGPLFHVICIKK